MIRLIGYFFGIGTALALLVAGGVAIYVAQLTKDLPDYEVLAKYSPPVTTRVHADDGSLIAEYAHERRLFLPIQAIPDRVKAAFLSAEDKNFYQHNGVDFQGLIRAVLLNLQNYGSGRRPMGASTITQQVAKNFLLTADQTMDSTGFQSAVRMVLTAGPSGFPVTGPDIGGYLGLFTDQVGLGDTPAQTADKLPTASLFIRWAQLGAISPFMEVAAPGPNNATQFWKRWGPEVTARFRNMAVLHYELFPEFWNRERDAHLTGAPIVRPLGYAYPDDATAWQQQQEGMLGDNLLFAMVSSDADFLTDEMFGKSLASVYLPKGHWVDVFRRTPVAGGRTVLRATTLEDFPFYLKAGAAVPFNSRAPIWADPWGLQQLQSKRRFGYLWAPTSRWTVNGGLSGRYRHGIASMDVRGGVPGGVHDSVVMLTNRVPRLVKVNGVEVPEASSLRELRRMRDGWAVYDPPDGQVGGVVVKASVEG